jgi:ribosomal-protein-alanine N-acetyltransferase
VQGGHAGIAYVLFRPFWRRGYARAAVAEMMGLLRTEHHVTRFGARVDTRNDRSRLLIESLGLKCVAIHPDAEEIRGQMSDEAEYVLDEAASHSEEAAPR